MRVTNILKACGLIDTAFMDEAAMKRGEYVHLACELDDKGDLDESTLDPLVDPYLAARRLFRKEQNPDILTIEEEVKHSHYGYEGRLDRRAMMDARECVLDIKTGQPAEWHSLQLAGYALCFDRPHARFGIYLSNDGRYKMTEYKDRKDYEVWKACVTLANWKTPF